MTISDPNTLKGFYKATKALGTKSINSDAWLEIEGQADLSLLIKQFPWPNLGSQGEIEAPLPLGSKMWLAQQVATAQQGPVTMTETKAGRVMSFMKWLISVGGEFNAVAYEGTPEKFSKGYKLEGCIFVPDATDRDWENRAQLTLINGTMFYHFFGEELQPNDLGR
jgi:hypothetical protein